MYTVPHRENSPIGTDLRIKGPANMHDTEERKLGMVWEACAMTPASDRDGSRNAALHQRQRHSCGAQRRTPAQKSTQTTQRAQA